MYSNGTLVGTVWSSGKVSTVKFTDGTNITSPSDGNILLLNNAGTGFNSLLLGGTTSSFSGIFLVGTAIHFKLSDSSAWANTHCNTNTMHGAAANAGGGTINIGGTTATTVGAAGAASALPANPVGYWIINVAGTQYKVPYYNN